MMKPKPRVEVISAILDVYEPGVLTIHAGWLKRIGFNDFPAEGTIILTPEKFILQPLSMPADETDAVVRVVKIQSNGRLCVPQARNLGLIGSRWLCQVKDNRIVGRRQQS